MNSMSRDGFRFDLFEPALKPVLSNCKYINLPFKLPDIYEEVNHLLTICAKTFFDDILDSQLEIKLKECLGNAKVVLHIAWEKINTGHWKDVDVNWRKVYTLGSLFKVLCMLLDKSEKKCDIIKACDLGLLMGAPVMQNILSKIAFKLTSMLIEEDNQEMHEHSAKKLKYSETDDDKIKCCISTFQNLDPVDFRNNFISNCKPVKLKKSIDDWPALSTSFWSVEYILSKARYRTVPIEIGSKYTDDKWTQKLMTVGEFVDEFVLNKSKQKEIGYLAQHNLFNQIPELFEDVRIPSYISENYGDADVDISVYFGPAGTVSPLHYDPKHNLLAQVIGRKYIRLYPPEVSERLYPRHGTWLSNTSEVDIDNPDFEAYPLFKDTPYEECILYPGDVLYIPPGYWHYVRSCSISLSISFWWDVPD